MWNPGWDELFASTVWGKYPCEDLIRFVARRYYRVPERAGVRFLEIGCGPGANLWYLAREGFDVTGLDGSARALAQAKERLAAEGLSVRLHRGDAMELPFADGTFDAVIDVECLYANSWADSRTIVEEVLRVLKPGGWLFSKTFATGMTGEETGVRLDGEAHTYLEMRDGPLHGEYGLIRLTAEAEIPRLYAGFADIQYDHVERTDRDRRFVLKEWIVAARR